LSATPDAVDRDEAIVFLIGLVLIALIMAAAL
jgi:hypothetical protein